MAKYESSSVKFVAMICWLCERNICEQQHNIWDALPCRHRWSSYNIDDDCRTKVSFHVNAVHGIDEIASYSVCVYCVFKIRVTQSIGCIKLVSIDCHSGQTAYFVLHIKNRNRSHQRLCVSCVCLWSQSNHSTKKKDIFGWKCTAA